MAVSNLDRRTFLRGSLAAGLMPTTALAGDVEATTAAAVQMGSIVGDMDANLEEAENWIRYAIRRGARWVVLPEFFLSGMSYRPEKMLDAVQPLDGEATQTLKRLATEGSAYVGGTFLAEAGDDVFNTFVLATPDGQVFTHDKDFPSGFVENSFYAGGEDSEFVKELKHNGIETLGQEVSTRKKNIKSGVFPVSSSLAVGVAICWEQLRYRTASRMRGKVDVVMASSTWGALDPDVGVAGVEKNDLIRWGAESRRMLLQAPRRLARLVGAPVIHANVVGSGWSKDGRKGKPPMFGRGLGSSQIVDSHGKVLAIRPASDGEGLVLANVKIRRATPTEQIPSDAAWIPECSESLVDSWRREGASGRNYYLSTARPYRNSD